MATPSCPVTSIGIHNNVNSYSHGGLATLSCPVASTGIQDNLSSFPVFGGNIAATSSVGIFSNVVHVQVQTVDGSVSTFEAVNMVPTFSTHNRQSTTNQAENLGVNAGAATHTPLVLDFSVGHMVHDANSAAAAVDNSINSRSNRASSRVGTRAGMCNSVASRQRILNGQPFIGNPNGPPAREPIAPTQREGAPLDYKYFGRCDQVCQHCGAYFGLKKGGRDCLCQRLHNTSGVVLLFRTARDKLQDADIPNFSIKLFGVVGANQYELPAGDSIGAIVYEGGPETMTDYDIVIERHSREPESVNKLHPRYMALQFPLLFIYGEEGYHLRLTLKNSVPGDQQEEKKMSMKVRVYRKWTAMKVPSRIPTGFSCMLLDKKGSAIQANADLKEKDRFERDLQMNCVYKIQGFGFDKTDAWGKTLDNDFTLCFGKYTQIDLLQDNDYPYHYFNFAAFNELSARLERKNPILTDYIGYVHNVEKVKEYGGATTNKVKVRNIGIRNLNNNVVLFTLWNEDADNFKEAEYMQMQPPVILAVRSCYIKRYAGQIQLSATSATSYYFNPDVEETGELLAAYEYPCKISSFVSIMYRIILTHLYKCKYSETNTVAPQLEVQTERLTDWEQERNRKRVPLGTLLQIDPNTQQRVLFTQDAMILRIDTAHEWYYQKCDECGGKLRYGYVHGQCHQYGNKPNPENRYSETNTVAPQLEVQTERLTDWEQERNRNRVPLGTLLQIDPNTQQRVLFTQDAMILRIDTAHEWYYQKCDECGEKLRYGYVHGQCHQYGNKPNPENRYRESYITFAHANLPKC
ncbi:hypothetical protein CTI12_AA168140 [Artemisia annua]|uniref:Replication protein A OB domain-containing protein n=1 Tax=Artemisia annua TaxID=35608 RepID=A0A2U1MJM2_ARTAN|nr:hypothetical protein CTI12_AA168140 [Artemisia annua]